ncbi:MAG: hypothetical protein ACI4YA_08625, partial [Candidatus Spyradenecus sp.]
SLAILIFCVSRRYWGWTNFLKEANAGSGLKLPEGMRWYMAYLLPTVMLFVFAASLLDKFGWLDPLLAWAKGLLGA